MEGKKSREGLGSIVKEAMGEREREPQIIMINASEVLNDFKKSYDPKPSASQEAGELSRKGDGYGNGNGKLNMTSYGPCRTISVNLNMFDYIEQCFMKYMKLANFMPEETYESMRKKRPKALTIRLPGQNPKKGVNPRIGLRFDLTKEHFSLTYKTEDSEAKRFGEGFVEYLQKRMPWINIKIDALTETNDYHNRDGQNLK